MNVPTFDDVFESCLYGFGEEDIQVVLDSLMKFPDSLDIQPPYMQNIVEDSGQSIDCEETRDSTVVSDHSNSSVPSGCGVRYIDRKFQDSLQIGLNENAL
jgi:hypothetical protein